MVNLLLFLSQVLVVAQYPWGSTWEQTQRVFPQGYKDGPKYCVELRLHQVYGVRCFKFEGPGLVGVEMKFNLEGPAEADMKTYDVFLEDWERNYKAGDTRTTNRNPAVGEVAALEGGWLTKRSVWSQHDTDIIMKMEKEDGGSVLYVTYEEVR